MSRESRLYVGNLPPRARERDVEDIFGKYGKIEYVEIKGRPDRGPPFAFIEFQDSRDAEDAVRGRDGYDFDGHRLRVEFTKGTGPRGPGGRPINGSRADYGSRSEDRYSRGGPPPRGRRNNYRLRVTGLPTSGSWQDLKDHMREAGDVAYADVFRDGTGVVEFMKDEDMKYALKKLDDSKFRSHEGETSRIRIREEESRSRSRSPKRRNRGSPKYSPARRSRSVSRSRSPRSKSRSASPRSKSRSRSY